MLGSAEDSLRCWLVKVLLNSNELLEGFHLEFFDLDLSEFCYFCGCFFSSTWLPTAGQDKILSLEMVTDNLDN